MAENYSVFSLPPELTSIIFALCLPSGPRSPSPHEAPLLLGQICRQWREICLDAPYLWDSISFGNTGSVELLKQWLAHAGNRPLTIHLRSKRDARASELIEAIIPHCPRWEDILLEFPMSAYSQLSFYSGPFPVLRRLALVASIRERAPAESIVIRDAPLLRDVRIINLPYQQVDLPLEQLTTLHINPFFGAAQATAALWRCPAVLDLSYSFSVDQHVAPTPVTLPSVRSLSIWGVSVLPYVSLPHLERLEIDYIGNIDAATAALQLLLSPASSNLQFLSIAPYDVPPASLRRFLDVAHSVVHLKLLFFSHEGFQSHVQVLGDDAVLPRLRRLEISDHAGGDHYGPLMDMLRARHTALDSFELALSKRALRIRPVAVLRIPPDDVMVQFRALAEAGLKLRISTAEHKGSRVLLDTPTD
ncbi:hypothetical protein FB451DRAFT_1552326 [Mycena latifolia]|nr:hypothetical protein FB451DRAFT_1552326 [Mycena latifolia]